MVLFDPMVKARGILLRKRLKASGFEMIVLIPSWTLSGRGPSIQRPSIILEPSAMPFFDLILCEAGQASGQIESDANGRTVHRVLKVRDECPIQQFARLRGLQCDPRAGWWRGDGRL